ncbi:MAG: NACHT domain-containing protein, partial [Chloroflexia bacterium]|nr:NACHT domain-containing protein [Chloroflexia bacterium]
MTGAEPLILAGSVWLWESYGKDAFAWLVKRLGKNLEDLKHAGWEKIDWARASQTYRQAMLRRYNSMHIFGMARPVPLSDVFTDVYLLDKPSAWRRHSIAQLQQEGTLHAEARPSDERHGGATLVAREPRLFILGQPGAGKTTFLKHLVVEAVQGRVNAIPIFVGLKEWVDSGLDLMPFLVRQFAICNFPGAQPFIEQILEDGKALVLFDGLDEVSEAQAQRQRITQALRDFAQQYGKSRVVITCRTAATEYTFEAFTYCEVADFTQAQIEAFVGRWFKDDAA